MADTNWKLEGDTSQPRTLYLEYNDREIYIHKIPKCNSDTTVERSVFLYHEVGKESNKHVKISYYQITFLNVDM